MNYDVEYWITIGKTPWTKDGIVALLVNERLGRPRPFSNQNLIEISRALNIGYTHTAFLVRSQLAKLYFGNKPRVRVLAPTRRKGT